MSGYIPDPGKGFLDYLRDAKYNALRKPIGVFKIVYGLVVFITIPLSLVVYLILVFFARRFMFSEIPELMGHVFSYGKTMIVTGYKDIFYRLRRR